MNDPITTAASESAVKIIASKEGFALVATRAAVCEALPITTVVCVAILVGIFIYKKC